MENAKAIRLAIITNDIRKAEFVKELGNQWVTVSDFSTEKYSVFSAVKKIDVLQATLYRSGDFRPVLYRFAIARLFGRKTVRLWVGTDVLLVIQNRRERWLSHLLNQLTDSNIVVSENLQTELLQVGISSVCLLQPFCNAGNVKLQPLPTVFTVLAYIPDSKKNFYGYQIVKKLAGEFPEIEFLLVGGNGAGEEALPNVEWLGIVSDMEAIYSRSSLVIRMTDHDGLPRMVIEALLRGRDVIWSYPFPCCYQATGYEEVKDVFTKLRLTGKVNQEGAAFVKETFDDARNAQMLAAHYQGLVNG